MRGRRLKIINDKKIGGRTGSGSLIRRWEGEGASVVSGAKEGAIRSIEGVKADIVNGFCGNEGGGTQFSEQFWLKALQGLANVKQIATAVFCFFEDGVELSAHAFFRGAKDVVGNDRRLRHLFFCAGSVGVGDLRPCADLEGHYGNAPLVGDFFGLF